MNTVGSKDIVVEKFVPASIEFRLAPLHQCPTFRGNVGWFPSVEAGKLCFPGRL
jgi:hypothetical protein